MTKEELATKLTIAYRASLLNTTDYRDMRQRLIDILESFKNIMIVEVAQND